MGDWMRMAKRLTPFGKEISKKLIDLERPSRWLLEQVREKTGLYFDDSYLYKIKTGQMANPKIVHAIQEILDLKGGSSDAEGGVD